MKVLIDGQLTEYTKQGEGPTVLLLHGWGTDSSSLKGVADFLAKDHTVVSLDFPGFGGSPAPSTDWFVGDYAAFVGAFITKLGLNVNTVMGHSFGGRVIIKGLAQGDFTASKFVLFGSAGVKPARSLKKQGYKAVAKIGKAVTAIPGLRGLRKNLRSRLYESAGATDYLQSGRLQKIFLNTINEDLLPLVEHINIPGLLVWGENDTDTPVSDAEKINQRLNESELIVIPQAGHYVFLDQPEAVCKELERFV